MSSQAEKPALNHTQKIDIETRTKKLLRGLQDLKQELDVGKVLASMSLVEASQAGKEFSAPLTDNAKNIASAIERIEVHVLEALKLVENIKVSKNAIKP